RFLEELRGRLRKFGLELHPDKTRLIVFGRKPENDWRWKGEGKPGTFDFLGFTHSCGRNRKGYYTVRRETAGKRMRAKLQAVKQQLRIRMHAPVAETGKWLRSVVQGYLTTMRYRAIANGCGRFGTGSGDSGGKRYAVEGSGGPGLGSALPHWPAGGFHRHEFCTRIRVFALTPNIRDKSRMREIRQYGSVRGALGDQSPYRDRNF